MASTTPAGDRVTPKLLIASQQLSNDTRFTKQDAIDFKALVISKDERALKLADLLDGQSKPTAEFVDRAKELLTIARTEGKVGSASTSTTTGSSGNGDDAKRPGTARKRPGLTVGTDKTSLTPSATPTSTPPPANDSVIGTTTASQPVSVPEPGSGSGTRPVRAGSGVGDLSARLAHRPQEISLKAVEVASATDEAAEEDANLRKRATRAAKRASLPTQLPGHVKDKVRPGTIVEEGKEDLATPAPQ